MTGHEIVPLSPQTTIISWPATESYNASQVVRIVNLPPATGRAILVQPHVQPQY